MCVNAVIKQLPKIIHQSIALGNDLPDPKWIGYYDNEIDTLSKDVIVYPDQEKLIRQKDFALKVLKITENRVNTLN